MTRRSPHAPTQVAMIHTITLKIDSVDWVFITDHELSSGTKLLEGEWAARLEHFVNAPENGITPEEERWAQALLTKRYARYLSARTVYKYTRILTTPSQAKPSKEQALEKVKRDIKRMTSQ